RVWRVPDWWFPGWSPPLPLPGAQLSWPLSGLPAGLDGDVGVEPVRWSAGDPPSPPVVVAARAAIASTRTRAAAATQIGSGTRRAGLGTVGATTVGGSAPAGIAIASR